MARLNFSPLQVRNKEVRNIHLSCTGFVVVFIYFWDALIDACEVNSHCGFTWGLISLRREETML